MPAILTHDFFGRDFYAANNALIGESPDARDAFLLGNQGPDPLFYLVAAPDMKAFTSLGSNMHHDRPTALIAAIRESLEALTDSERLIGEAYAAGFLCHYTLDSSAHPFIYAQQFAICDAGLDGITRADGNDVHAEIERTIDEVVLVNKMNLTIREYRPYKEVLNASEDVLRIIGKMYVFVCLRAYRLSVPDVIFSRAVHGFRLVQRLMYSPEQTGHKTFNAIERGILGRGHSFYAAMAHRVNESSLCAFDNHEHASWANPFTGEISTVGFWDIYAEAQRKAQASIELFQSPEFDSFFDLESARKITHGLDFSGEPVE